MNTPVFPSAIPLGREVDYPRHYDASLLFPIPRTQGRDPLGIGLGAPLPFVGHDRWHAYELGWLDARGKPRVGTATLVVPATSPNLIESKSLKLYLNSFNAHRVESDAQLFETMARDLSVAAGAPVQLVSGLPPIANAAGACIDALDVAIDHYGPPDATQLAADPRDSVDETLVSHLLKSNCPVTGQPDWASLSIAYAGPRIDRAGLLRYIAGFRDHCDFHEQCVERIFVDVMTRCAPTRLSVEARYTRRGGLDINPWRGTPGVQPPTPVREARQ